MLKAIIEHKNNTLLLEFPCKRMLLAEHLASLGIRTAAHDIKCTDEEDAPIKVKIYGESEFDAKLASVVSPENTLSVVNSFCEIYHNMPYATKLGIQEAILNGEVSSLKEFGQLIAESPSAGHHRTLLRPLIATVYFRGEYGNMEEYPDEYDGEFLASYEDRIRELIQREESLDEANLADYFDGSNSAVAKLKEIHFSTQNVDGVLYGDIRVELTEPFTPRKKPSSRIGQSVNWQMAGVSHLNSVKSASTKAKCMSAWNSGDDYFMLNSHEFDEYLAQNQGMGGIE